MVDVISCAEWRAVPRDTDHLPLHTPKGICIHHTATASTLPYKTPTRERRRSCELAQAIQLAHLNRGWLDSGHHFLVCRGGLVLEGRHGSLSAAERGLVIQGAHAGTNDGNRFWWGVETEGNTDKAALTEEQFDKLADLCAWLAFVGDFDTQQILPHQEFTATACPGHWLMEHLDTLKSLAHARKLVLMAASG